MKHLRLFAVLLLGGLLFSSCEEIEKLDRETRERNLKNLQEWVVNSTTSQEAINQFGYEKCFTITTIGEYYWTDFMNYYAGDKSVITKDQLAAVRSLFYDKQMMDPIKIGEIICNKSISSDLLDIFRKLYEAHYSITELMPVGIATYERVTEDVNAYYGPTFSFQYMGDNVILAHVKGLAVVLNPGTPPTAGDLAVKLFKEHGFTWGGDEPGGKTYYFEKK